MFRANILRNFNQVVSLKSIQTVQRLVPLNMAFSTSASNRKDKLLFTPGPLGVSYDVKAAMLKDLGSRDIQFMDTIKYIRSKMLQVANISSDEFTMIPMQGSGTFAIEAVIMSMVPKTGGKMLLPYTGSYGKRMNDIAKYSKIETVVIESNENEYIDLNAIEDALIADKSITNVAVVHCETSTGVIHPIHEVGELVRKHAPQATFFVDAMSSFGAIPIDMTNIDFLVTSANKCIQGVPGFGVVIAQKDALMKCQGNCRSLSLDIVDQYLALEKNGQFRFTPPTHAILAFKKALEEWEAEGGVDGRAKRYSENREILRKGMSTFGFKEFLSPDHEGYIITSYRFPSHKNFVFKQFYDELNQLDMVIYPGKTTEADCFRIGNIGNLYPQDMLDLLDAIEKVCGKMNLQLPLTS